MPRRSEPAAPPTTSSAGPRERRVTRPRDVRGLPADAAGRGRCAGDRAPSARQRRAKPSGRVRHDEKMTVYVTSDELLDLEHARLSLRRAQGLAVDRGRLVREAVALVLADYEANGDDSVLVRRLTERMTVRRRRVWPRASSRGAGPGVRGPARQLRGPLRPAAEPDRQAQARHHRGRPVAGHRRVHRPRQGRWARHGSSSRRRRSCWWPRPCSTSRRRGCCRRATSRTRRTSPCSRRATCSSPGCCSTARSSRSPACWRTGWPAESRRHPRAVGLEERFATLLPEVLIGIGLGQFAELAARALEPKPVLEVSLQHIHAGEGERARAGRSGGGAAAPLAAP